MHGETVKLEKRCSGIWKMTLKSIYKYHGECIGSSWLRWKSNLWTS